MHSLCAIVSVCYHTAVAGRCMQDGAQVVVVLNGLGFQLEDVE